MISKGLFFRNVDNLPNELFSGRHHKKYTNIYRIGNILYGQREAGTIFNVDLDILYRAYTECENINTVVLRDKGYVKGFKRSPSVAIMKAAGLLDEDGYTIK